MSAATREEANGVGREPSPDEEPRKVGGASSAPPSGLSTTGLPAANAAPAIVHALVSGCLDEVSARTSPRG